MGDSRDGQSSNLHIVKTGRPVLDAICVAALATQLDPLDARPVALDLSSITGHTARGLSSLIELLMRHPQRKLAICGLSRALLLAAIDLSLAELCAICTDVAAFERCCLERGP